jgi:GntR family transcriptional repressor for pyruvate dehydrogenase complex
MDNVFSKIGTSQTLSQKIERKIEEAIRTKKLMQGQKLPTEKSLCETFDVSRTAIREALRRLNARGLVDIRKGDGMYVSKLTMDKAINSLNLYYDINFDESIIEHIIQARRLFEPQIAVAVAENRTKRDIEILSSINNKIINTNPDYVQKELDLDNKFHQAMVTATKNPILQATMEPIYSLLPRMRAYFYGNIDGEKQKIVEKHTKIIEAIKNQDETLVFKLSLEHVQRAEEIYEEKFRESIFDE